MRLRHFLYLIGITLVFSGVAAADTSGLVQAEKAYFDGIRSGQYKSPSERAELASRTIGAAQMQYDRAMAQQWKTAVEGAAQPSAYRKDVLEPSLWDSLASMFHMNGKKTAQEQPPADNTLVVQPQADAPNPGATPAEISVDGNGIPRLIEFGKRKPASAK